MIIWEVHNHFHFSPFPALRQVDSPVGPSLTPCVSRVSLWCV